MEEIADIAEKAEVHIHLHIDGPITLNVTIKEPASPVYHLEGVPGTPVRNEPKGTPPMADFILEDDQNVDVAVIVLDGANNPVAGADLDAGSLTVTAADNDVTLGVTVSADQSTFNAQAIGPLITDNVVTMKATLAGAPLEGTLAFDVVDSAPASLGAIPGTPQTNTGPFVPPAPPVTTPPAPETPVDDPGDSLPLYTYSGTDTPDPTEWTAVTDVEGPNGETLYVFAGDTAGNPPTGVSGPWALFQGTPSTVAPPS